MTYTERVSAYLKSGDMRQKSQPDCAKRLCMCVVTLQRRLKAEGTTWRAMVEQEKRGRIVALLARNPHADSYRLADAGGFSQRNSAGRKFVRLFGMTVTEYKRRAAA